MRTQRLVVAAGLATALLISGAGCSGGSPQAAPHTPATSIALAPPTATEPVAKRPNILVIETDDMRWDDLRWMPNVRRLIARKGLDFKNSFAPYPLCCPSRASFLTGEYAHNHHVYSHLNPWGFKAFDDHLTLATQLQGVGYRTALIGKYLNGYGQQPMRGANVSSLHYVPPGWTQWLAGSDHLWSPGQKIQGNTYDYFDLVQNINGAIKNWPGQYSTDVLARQTRSLIERWRKGPKPWFIWWTPVAPHFGTPEESDDPRPTLATDGMRTTWPTPARPDWVKGYFDKTITHGLGTPPNHLAEPNVSDKPSYIRNRPELDPAEKAAETSLTRQRAESLFVLDIQIGRTLSRLSRTGQMKNTLIMFTSDNGYYLGEHRKRQGKINLHEPSLRVPLLLAGPGVPHGSRYDPATTVDIAPTLAAYAGTTMPGADGIDLRPIITGGDQGWIRPVVTEGMMENPMYETARHLPGSPLNTRGLRLGRWKLTRYKTGETELYDLLKDPLELHSLQDVAKDQPILRRMNRLFARYENCKQAQCSAPLPADLQLTPAQEKALTDAEIRATNRYYGNAPISAPFVR